MKHDTDVRAHFFLCGMVACHSRDCRQLKSYCLVVQVHISVNKGLGVGFTGTARNQSMKVLDDDDDDDDNKYKTFKMGNNIRYNINY